MSAWGLVGSGMGFTSMFPMKESTALRTLKLQNMEEDNGKWEEKV